jgi:hypothetical protein
MATDGGGGSGYPDCPHSFSPLTWYFAAQRYISGISAP